MKRNFTSALGKKTQTAGTVIVMCVPGRKGHFTSIDQVVITTGATAHVLIFMNAIPQPVVTSDTKGPEVAAAAAAGQGVVTVTGALQDAAGNAAVTGDYFAVQLSDGTWAFGTATLSNAGLTLTFGASFAQTILKGAKVFYYALSNNAYHANHTVDTIASQTPQVIPSGGGQAQTSLLTSDLRHAPILVYDANATNADTVETVNYSHSHP